MIVRARTNPAGHLVFDVSDDGPGIAPELSEHILQPFFTTRSKGNGLGLAVVQDVVDAHGGLLEVSSEPGAGSRFSMSIAPVTPETAPELPLPMEAVL